MRGTVAEVIKVARGEIGTTESPAGSNNTKYGTWYGFNGVPWCNIWVSWVFNRARVLVPKFAYTPSCFEWFRSEDRAFVKDSRARRGDVVFFDFPDSTPRIQHVGLVLSNSGSSLATIEGNTSSGTSGSQDDGGGVFPRVRGYGEAVGYGRPPYRDAEPPIPEFDFPKKATFGKGDSGADIRHWQIDLNRWIKALDDRPFFFKINVDGHFGEKTERATKSFQHFYHLDASGEVGVKTIAVMERERKKQRDG